ncbi:MAG: ATP-binding cassette domain-containing protein [Spirochaetaceae bacterium]|nr:ATP-binding cassette domain-containing protein [Spirochaetaceae bacterium]
MPFLNVNHLSFAYAANTENQKTALDDVSFLVTKGEYLVITGSNGSGKSTLARLIAGLLQVQEGTVTGDAYRSTAIQKSHTKKSTAESVPNGIVMQNPKTQLIAETVIKDACFGPENLKLPKDECQKRALAALKLMDLLEAQEQRTVTLSGGQQQKLCIAGILALSPELLILDEALSMIDPERRSLILDYIDEYHKNGGTILSITHNKEEAARSSRLIHLEQGKLVYDGTFRDFYENFRFFKPNYTKAVTASSADAANVIEVQNIEYAHPKQAKLFEHFSLSIQKGTLTAVIGQSGSGKSTLFELLSGLLIPAGGSIYASSRPVLASQDCASTIFEEFAADDVAYGPQQLGVSGKELKQRVRQSMDITGVPFKDYADRRTTFLSGGERRKVSIAGIIALDAEIYLFDEPTAGLDPESAVATIKLLQNLCAQGKTVVFSTHRTEEAEAAERIITLSQGKIINDTAGAAGAQVAICTSSSDGAVAQADTDAAAKIDDVQSGYAALQATACTPAGAGTTAENDCAKPTNRATSTTLSKIEPFANAADIASFSSSALGGYHKGSTIAHKMTPLAKYIVLLAFFVAALSLSNIPLLSAVCAAGIFYALLARYPVKKLFTNFLIVLPWILLFFVFQLVFFPPKDGETVYFQFYFISLTARKIKLGIVTLLHYVGVLCPLSVFVYTATESDITDGMEALLKPLELLGVPTKHICLVTSIIFRFIPLLMEEAAVILKAQTVRSSGTLRQQPKKSSLISKFKLLLPLFVPLFIRTLQRAESLAEALDARYYGYY